MIEMRWVIHDLAEGGPPMGSIHVCNGMYQKLQYRVRLMPEPNPWIDVPMVTAYVLDTSKEPVKNA